MSDANNVIPRPPRDLMAPDTEPTDEELAIVMREARDLAIERRVIADEWIADQLRQATERAHQFSSKSRMGIGNKQ